MNILLMSGSLRKDSLNRKLLKNIVTIIQENNLGTVQIADLKTLAFPVYDGDIEAAEMPAGVKTLGQMIAAADVFITCSPEYNGSIAGSFKNAIDWVSRLRPVPLEGKPILLTGASPGGFGAIRGLGNSRGPFEANGSYVYPSTFALPKAHEAFTPDDVLIDEGTKKRLADTVTKFLKFAEKLK
jgi:chromate reductase